MMFTCTRCNKSETRLPSLPCGPCRKIVSRKLAATRGATAAMVACLVLLSAPTGALASTTKTVVAGGRLAGLVTNKGLIDNGNNIHMARLLEGEEESPVAIDVGTQLSAAAAGEQDHDEEEEHLHLFDEDHEDEHLHEDHDEEEEGHDDHGHDDNDHDEGEEGHDEHGEEGHDEHEHDEEFHTAHTDEHSEDKPKPWGYVILSTVIVNFTSLSGLLLLLIPAIHRGYLSLSGSDPSAANADKGRLFDVCVPAFAVGALMATAFFLVLPEALHLVEGGHSDHGDEEEGGHDDHSDHRYLEGEEAESSESVNAAKFGCAVLGGFLLPMLFGLAFHRHGPTPEAAERPSAITSVNTAEAGGNSEERDDAEEANKDGKASVVTGTDAGCDCCSAEKPGNDVETGVVVRKASEALPETIVLNKDANNTASSPAPQARDEFADSPTNSSSVVLPTKRVIDYRLVAAVVVGDAFCNFVDGLFIGAAFLGCSWATTLSILMVTLFHELPQEMADFLLLTRYAGLTTLQACLVNFGSGLIVTLGGLVVLAGSTSDEVVGVILAMAGGCYINIAACETVPRMEKHLHSFADRAAMVFSFIVGTVPIGLVLLKHEHC